MKKHLLTLTIAVIAVMSIMPSIAEARMTQLQLNAQAIRKCDAFRYQGRSPSNQICRSLLMASRTVKEPGRRANRTWIYNRSLLKLVRKESGFAHYAKNPYSGACGLGQMLPCDKYGPHSCWKNLGRQAKCLIRYILRRYRTPEAAWRFWVRNGWY